MPSTIPTPQDKRLLLQDLVTKTAAYNSPSVDLGNAFAPGGIGLAMSALVAVVTRSASGGQTYSFCVEESDDNATFKAAGAVATITAVGVTVAKAVITKRYIRLALTTTGTAPSIMFKAWLNPLA